MGETHGIGDYPQNCMFDYGYIIMKSTIALSILQAVLTVFEVEWLCHYYRQFTPNGAETEHVIPLIF